MKGKGRKKKGRETDRVRGWEERRKDRNGERKKKEGIKKEREVERGRNERKKK